MQAARLGLSRRVHRRRGPGVRPRNFEQTARSLPVVQPGLPSKLRRLCEEPMRECGHERHEHGDLVRHVCEQTGDQKLKVDDRVIVNEHQKAPRQPSSCSRGIGSGHRERKPLVAGAYVRCRACVWNGKHSCALSTGKSRVGTCDDDAIQQRTSTQKPSQKALLGEQDETLPRGRCRHNKQKIVHTRA
eukprot:Amastigsp_a511147_6.p2 type:complete len:188 gc:universal Amastigsp_a511147_6:831-268(-)